jgi:acyl dehydratase
VATQWVRSGRKVAAVRGGGARRGCPVSCAAGARRGAGAGARALVGAGFFDAVFPPFAFAIQTPEIQSSGALKRSANLCASVPGRTFEQFTPGAVIEHKERLKVTQEDNAAFCRLTRNTQPLHLDETYAKTTPFGRIAVNGLYTFSAAVGVSVADTTAGTLVANLGYEDVQHPAPVFPGDTLSFTTEVLEKRPSSKPGRGVVTLRHVAKNQEGIEVCTFKRIVMVQAGVKGTAMQAGGK